MGGLGRGGFAKKTMLTVLTGVPAKCGGYFSCRGARLEVLQNPARVAPRPPPPLPVSSVGVGGGRIRRRAAAVGVAEAATAAVVAAVAAPPPQWQRQRWRQPWLWASPNGQGGQRRAGDPTQHAHTALLPRHQGRYALARGRARGSRPARHASLCSEGVVPRHGGLGRKKSDDGWPVKGSFEWGKRGWGGRLSWGRRCCVPLAAAWGEGKAVRGRDGTPGRPSQDSTPQERPAS